MTDDEQRRPVTTAATSLGILEQLKSGGPMGPTGLASELGLAKSTVHRHLKTLEREGFVVPDDDGYRVGLRLLDFGIYARDQHQLYEVAKPKLDELAEQTGEKVWCVTEEQGRGFHLYGAAGAHSVRTPAREGTRSYLHQLAAGKAILSAFPDERVRDIVDRHGLPAKTDATITDRDELFDELDAIRERGYACNDEEEIEGLRAVGAPIRDRNGTVLGALSVSGPTSRIKGEQFRDTIPEMVTSTANIIEVNMNMAARSSNAGRFD